MVTWKSSREKMPPADEEVLMFQAGCFNILCWQPHSEGAWLNYESWFAASELGEFFWMPLPDEPDALEGGGS